LGYKFYTSQLSSPVNVLCWGIPGSFKYAFSNGQINQKTWVVGLGPDSDPKLDHNSFLTEVDEEVYFPIINDNLRYQMHTFISNLV